MCASLTSFFSTTKSEIAIQGNKFCTLCILYINYGHVHKKINILSSTSSSVNTLGQAGQVGNALPSIFWLIWFLNSLKEILLLSLYFCCITHTCIVENMTEVADTLFSAVVYSNKKRMYNYRQNVTHGSLLTISMVDTNWSMPEIWWREAWHSSIVAWTISNKSIVNATWGDWGVAGQSRSSTNLSILVLQPQKLIPIPEWYPG